VVPATFATAMEFVELPETVNVKETISTVQKEDVVKHVQLLEMV
jgi:hypothetical protein